MTLEALCAQVVSDGEFEIIVVDDGASPPIAVRLQAYKGRLQLRSIRREHVGPSAARNAGARLAASALLIFLDDDCAPDPHWLEAYLKAHLDEPESALAGPILNALPDDISSEAYHLIFAYLYSRHIEQSATRAPFLISANCAVPKALFHLIGGFDERFLLASEDRMFSEEWLRSGKTVRAVPDAIVSHYRPFTVKSFVAQQYRYGRGAMILRKELRARGWSARPLENSSFYTNLLLSAFHYPKPADRIPLFLLLVLSQAAIAAGQAAESFGPDLPERNRK